MYSIKQASIRSGVSVPLIRAWERRYGLVAPKRTASGYRLYDDEAIATLARARELTESGWAASEANRAILAGEVKAAPVAPLPAWTEAEAGVHGRQADLIGRFLAAATNMDITATGAVLDEMFAQGSFESIVDDLLMPALGSLGQAWVEGRLDVAAEHAASAAIHRRLSALYEAAAVIGDASVVVGLPPEGRHELGALAFAVALRRLGAGVLYLGADVPIGSWVHVVRQQRARVVVLAVVQDSDQPQVLEVAAALRAAGHSPVFAVGGRSASWDGAREAGIVVLPDRINEAASLVARLAAGTSAAR
jgi:DNA-binding transcriptional MerR regulator/methylmalonyl-CoA mutase cobalamin-binding subunit